MKTYLPFILLILSSVIGYAQDFFGSSLNAIYNSAEVSMTVMDNTALATAVTGRVQAGINTGVPGVPGNDSGVRLLLRQMVDRSLTQEVRENARRQLVQTIEKSKFIMTMQGAKATYDLAKQSKGLYESIDGTIKNAKQTWDMMYGDAKSIGDFESYVTLMELHINAIDDDFNNVNAPIIDFSTFYQMEMSKVKTNGLVDPVKIAGNAINNGVSFSSVLTDMTRNNNSLKRYTRTSLLAEADACDAKADQYYQWGRKFTALKQLKNFGLDSKRAADMTTDFNKIRSAASIYDKDININDFYGEGKSGNQFIIKIPPLISKKMSDDINTNLQEQASKRGMSFDQTRSIDENAKYCQAQAILYRSIAAEKRAQARTYMTYDEYGQPIDAFLQSMKDESPVTNSLLGGGYIELKSN